MRIRNIKTALYSHKSVILGLVFVLLALTLSCGYFQTASHSANAEGMQCDRSLFLTNYVPTKDDGLLGDILVFSLIALTFFIKGDAWPRGRLHILFRPSIIFNKNLELISKLYNPILEALRRGILHPQIYNVAVIR